MRQSGQGGSFACFRQVADFERDAIRRPRCCGSYYFWNRGHSPKDHAMLERDEQELQARKAQWLTDRRVTRFAIGVSIFFGIVGTILGVLSHFG